MISSFLAHRHAYVISRTNCDISDTFTALWMKALKDIEASKRQPSIGFGGSVQLTQSPAPMPLAMSDVMTPDGVRRALQELSRTASLIVIFDEFDRIKNPELITAMADTIKCLSDYSVDVTVLIIGVADSVDELIREHQSIERALIQVPMPRMSDDEIRGIIDSGLRRLSLRIDSVAREELVRLSQGLPYITHLLCIYSCRAALATGRKTIFPAHVEQGMNRSLDQWQQSIKSVYNESTQSAHPEHLYREVLLSCAMAEIDDLRYFTIGAVREPLCLITKKNFEVAHYARHLRELSEPGRGRILQRIGESYRLRYRIANPILRPYIIMRGIKDKMITTAMLDSAGPKHVENAALIQALSDHEASIPQSS